jgi:hypothetical protein
MDTTEQVEQAVAADKRKQEVNELSRKLIETCNGYELDVIMAAVVAQLSLATGALAHALFVMNPDSRVDDLCIKVAESMRRGATEVFKLYVDKVAADSGVPHVG